jgi:hypothetical protein
MIDTHVTREFLDARRAEDRAYLDTRLATLRNEIVMWVFGVAGLGTVVNHWWR